MSIGLKSRYKEMLKNEFPIEHKNVELFHKNTFDGDDEIDYFNSTAIFRGKKWDEVDFRPLITQHIEFLMLNEDGLIYYFPAFLNNFYDLESKYFETRFFEYFLSGLKYGFSIMRPNGIDDSIKNKTYKEPVNYDSFKKITPSQSKLVAVFLVNVANLLPFDWHDSRIAQQALTNYWGNFLLF